jgi:hypothetical protein
MPQEDSWYSFLLEAESTQGSDKEKDRQEKIQIGWLRMPGVVPALPYKY